MNDKYCRLCGAELIVTKIPNGFNESTGVQEFLNLYKCPNKKGFFDFGHREDKLATGSGSFWE